MKLLLVTLCAIGAVVLVDAQGYQRSPPQGHGHGPGQGHGHGHGPGQVVKTINSMDAIN